jgi:hypothetical protein
MGYQEANGGPRTSAGPAFFGGLSPATTEGAVLLPGSPVPSPLELATFLRKRPPAAHNGADRSSSSVVRFTTSTGMARRQARKARAVEEERARQEAGYARTPIHDAIAEELTRRSPDWFTLIDRLTKHPFHDEVKNIQGRLAELYVDQVIRDLAQTDRFRQLIQINPLDNLDSEEFSFRREWRGGLLAINLNGKGNREIDNAFLVRYKEIKTPTLVEVKAGSTNFGGDHIDEFLQRNHLTKAVRAVESRYDGARAAVMLVTTRDGIDLASDAVKEFQAQGGYVVIMKPTTEDFRTYAKRIHDAKDGQIRLPPPKDAVRI